MTDPSDVSKEATIRNRDFATVTGFMVIFIYSTILVACCVKDLYIYEVFGEYKLFLALVPFTVLIFSAGVLAWCKERFLVASMFIMYGFGILAPMFPMVVFGEPTLATQPIGVVLIIFAIALITARKKQEFLCAIILIIMGVASIVNGIDDANVPVKEIIMVMCGINAVISAYCVISFANANPNLPGYRFFTGAGLYNEPEDFREAGIATGFMIMAAPMLACTMHYLDIGHVTTNDMAGIETTAGITLMLLSVILILTAYSKFTPFLFLMVGATMTLTSFITEIGQVICVFMLLIGITCFLRKESKIMIGIALILYGFTYLISTQFVDNGNATLSAILNLVPCAIAIYLVFAYYSEKHLPIA